MKSFRLWLTTLALGSALIFSSQSARAQFGGVPRGFTYQGLLEVNGNPIADAAAAQITIILSLTPGGTPLYTNTYSNVALSPGGIFNLVIGNPFNIDFKEQYYLTATVTTASGGGVPVTLPPTALWSAPYAINSGTVNGLEASATPVAGNLFPVPLGSGYTGSAKIDPAFLPPIPNSILSTPAITTINDISPNSNGIFTITAPPGSGITIGQGPNGITISDADDGLNTFGNASSSAVGLTVQNSEVSGNEALLITGGIGANNPTNAPDGSGLSPGSPQTYWADQISVPAAAGTSLQIYNKLVSISSTIILTPFALSAAVGQLAVTAQSAGSFTVTSSSVMGTSGGGVLTGLNYLIINH